MKANLLKLLYAQEIDLEIDSEVMLSVKLLQEVKFKKITSSMLQLL